MAYKPGDRISSSKALQHPTFTSLSPLAALAKLGSAFNKAGQVRHQHLNAGACWSSLPCPAWILS